MFSSAVHIGHFNMMLCGDFVAFVFCCRYIVLVRLWAFVFIGIIYCHHLGNLDNFTLGCPETGMEKDTEIIPWLIMSKLVIFKGNTLCIYSGI